MARKRLLAHLYPYHILILVLSLFAATLYASRVAQRLHLRSTEESLIARARLAEREVEHYTLAANAAAVDSVCKEMGRAASARITIVLATGAVVGDSHDDFRRMENHGDRPEIVQALAGRTGMSVRYSDTERKKTMYVAVPLERRGEIVGAVRASLPLVMIAESLRGMYLRIFLGGVVVTLLAALVSFAISRRISRPLNDLREGVERFEEEGLSYRLPVSRYAEIGSLADTINDLAERLDARIRTEVRQLAEQEAVFSSMVEGLIVIDGAGKVTRLNRSAARLLGVEYEGAAGKNIQELVRSTQLQKFIASALSAAEPIEGDIALRGEGGDRLLQAHGMLLPEPEEHGAGAVVVLNDVTRLQRLEGVRRDFVANVSHELKTPITSIKGFVETLRDGAVRRPDEAAKFLDIVAKQADRMNSIVDDLLLLSRVEQDARDERVALESVPLKGVLLEAVRICEPKAQARDIRISVDCPDGVVARINAPLLEQAIVNLVDNAIKYSEPGRPVSVVAEESPGEVAIHVRDEGPGIEAEHLSRIFERFYRVDKARSRTLGGTGLGLAIVKHIVQALGGSVTVKSAPGAGSTFSIHLPNIS